MGPSPEDEARDFLGGTLTSAIGGEGEGGLGRG